MYLRRVSSQNNITYSRQWCHISTPTVALACATGGPHRGGSSRRGALRVWLRAHAPATRDRQPHTDNAHHSAHTCAPGTSSHMRTSGICTALSSAHARQTQQMQCSHSFGDLVFILRSPARAHDLGCSKTPEVDCVDLSHAPHKAVAQWNNANGIYTAPRSARDTADGWCSKTPKDGRRELHCSMARGIGTG